MPRRRSHHFDAVLRYVPVVIDADPGRARATVKPLLAHYLGALHGQSLLEDAGLPAARKELRCR